MTGTADAVEVWIEDRGPGVPAGARSRLFEGRAIDAGAGANSGLGLGLQLSKALVEAMGGSIRYEDRSGGGAAFVVRLVADHSLVLDTPD